MSCNVLRVSAKFFIKTILLSTDRPLLNLSGITINIELSKGIAI